MNEALLLQLALAHDALCRQLAHAAWHSYHGETDEDAHADGFADPECQDRQAVDAMLNVLREKGLLKKPGPVTLGQAIDAGEFWHIFNEETWRHFRARSLFVSCLFEVEGEPGRWTQTTMPLGGEFRLTPPEPEKCTCPNAHNCPNPPPDEQAGGVIFDAQRGFWRLDWYKHGASSPITHCPYCGVRLADYSQPSGLCPKCGRPT